MLIFIILLDIQENWVFYKDFVFLDKLDRINITYHYDDDDDDEPKPF